MKRELASKHSKYAGECSIIIFTLISMQGHQKGVYPLIFIPSADDLDEDDSDGPTIRPGLDELEL